MRQPEKRATQSATWWSAALVLGAITAAMAPAILLAAGGAGVGFDAVVRGIGARYHGHVNKIPFMGLISLVAGHATHGGVRGLHIAEIEHLDGPVDGTELNALVAQRMGAGWQRIVRDTSRSGDEQSLIYVKPEGARMGMLIVDLDQAEMDVVQISINPDKLSDEIMEHRHGKSGDASDDKSNEKPDSDESE